MLSPTPRPDAVAAGTADDTVVMTRRLVTNMLAVDQSCNDDLGLSCCRRYADFGGGDEFTVECNEDFGC